jgi:hypothetical protein
MKPNNVFIIKRNDTLPAIQACIRTRGCLGSIIPFDLSGVTACTFSMSDDCGNLVVSSASAQITSSSGGTVQYSWASVDTASTGKFQGEFELLFSTGDKMTVPTIGNISIQILDDINGS